MTHFARPIILAAAVLLAALPALAQDSGFTEEFVNVTLLAAQGWAAVNRSSPEGITSWGPFTPLPEPDARFQGNDEIFAAYSGAAHEYIATNFNAAGDATGLDTISDWLISPTVSFRDGDTLSFWSRSAVSTNPFPDRMEVRLSTSGASTDVGGDETTVGDFDELLLAINPDLVYGDYPDTWTHYVITISGHPAMESGRFAFRYWVTDSGPTGNNGDYIGLDLVEFSFDPGDVVVFHDGFESGDTTRWSLSIP